MAKKSVEELMEGRAARRAKEEERFMAKLARRMEAAEAMIGQVMRGGQVVFYVWPAGGKYREGKWLELVEFLMRARFV